MKMTYNEPYKIFFTLSIIILIIIFTLSIYEFGKLRHSRYWVIHSYEVMLQTKEINKQVLDLNLKAHQYVIHNNPDELYRYLEIEKSIKQNLGILIELTKDNPQQNKMSIKLQELVNLKLGLLASLIKLQKEDNALSVKKSELMRHISLVYNEFNQNANTIHQVEQSLLADRSATLKLNNFIVIFILIAGEALAILLILVSFYILSQELRRRKLAEKHSKNVEGQIRSIIEGSRDMIAALDLNYRYIFYNRAYEEEFFKIFNKNVSIGVSLIQILKDVPTGVDVIKSWEKSLNGIHKKETIEIKTSEKIETFELTSSPVKDINNQMIGAVHIVRNITERAKERLSLKNAYDKVSKGMAELTEKNKKITSLVEMSDILLACSSLSELCQITAKFAKTILNFTNGILYIMHPSKKMLERNANWGDMKKQENLFEPDKCWALRLGHINYSSTNTELFCEHLNHDTLNSVFICVPLRAHNEVYGVLVVEVINHSSGELLTENENLILNAFSELIALSLSNVSLRENLQQQSFHDPLTSLYNRRFLNEFLNKQFILASRQKSQIAILMLDVDHFKKINDTLGHDAGDRVLREIASLLLRSIRSGDLAARYGGEEFIIGFFNANDVGAIKERALKIMNDIKQLSLSFNHQTIKGITVSIGIAFFPLDGKTVNEVIDAADKALYQAKESGRNKAIFTRELI